MGNEQVYSIFGLLLTFFVSGSYVPGCDWRRNFTKTGDGFSFFVVATRLSRKKMCTVTAKQHNCRLLVLKRNIQNVTRGFALFTVVETSRFIG